MGRLLQDRKNHLPMISMHRATRLPETAFDRAYVRRQRLERIIDRLNRLHRHRRVRGRATAWLLPRAKRVTEAWITARGQELQAS